MLIATYIQMNIFFILLLALIVFHVNRAKYGRPKQELVLYNIHLVTIAIAILLDAFGWAVNEQAFAGAYVLNYIINTLTFLMNPLLTLAWFIFIVYKAQGKFKIGSPFGILAGVALFVNIVLCLSNYWTKFYFYVDADNIYHRGGGFWVMPALTYIFTFLSTVISAQKYIHTRNNTDTRRNAFILMIYTWPSTLGGVLQTLFYGFVGTWMATTFSVCMYYIYDTMFRLEKMQRLELELQESRISTMMSQIKPHFLYNTLTAIVSACDASPDAQRAIKSFSKYLRGNLDSISDNALIPFEKELKHIESYLELEKLRFEDMLNIIYDIHVNDFLLPSLTIQPLVENAVKHGVGKKTEGGTVTITSKETDTNYMIIVSDDGVGFDVNEKTKDGNKHIGIENSMYRLQIQCGGSLDIISEKERGTIATVKIPKVNPKEVSI